MVSAVNRSVGTAPRWRDGALQIREHELVVAGPVRELYLVGPRDTDDATAWRTEIGWPIFRTG